MCAESICPSLLGTKTPFEFFGSNPRCQTSAITHDQFPSSFQTRHSRLQSGILDLSRALSEIALHLKSGRTNHASPEEFEFSLFVVFSFVVFSQRTFDQLRDIIQEAWDDKAEIILPEITAEHPCSESPLTQFMPVTTVIRGSKRVISVCISVQFAD
jgi:hypothetical protein